MALGCFGERDTLHTSHRSWTLLILRAQSSLLLWEGWLLGLAFGTRSPLNPGDGPGRRDRWASVEGTASELSAGSLLHLFFLFGFPFSLVHQAAGDCAAS